MKRLSVQKAETLASIFRSQIGISLTEPISAKTLLRKLNITAMYRPLSEDSYGISCKSKSGKMFMMINSNSTRGRQHFTIAHELYHLTQDPGEKENLVDRPEYAQIQAQLLDELQNWYYTYADPAVDGTREGVTGFGQMRRPGIHSEGKPVYATSPKYQKA